MPQTDDRLTRLRKNWEVTERPFHSPTPLVGPLIARLRTIWNNIATRWYVRPLLQQQNSFNQLVVFQLEQIEAESLSQSAYLTDQDHARTELVRQLAELSCTVVALQQQIAALEAELTDRQP